MVQTCLIQDGSSEQWDRWGLCRDKLSMNTDSNATMRTKRKRRTCQVLLSGGRKQDSSQADFSDLGHFIPCGVQSSSV
jgi:hypothetical protein